MIIESIKNYFEACPHLADGVININYLGDRAVCYSIDNVEAEPVIKRYCDGGILKQFVFKLALRDVYDENVLRNMKIAQFFEQIEAWIASQNQKGILPQFEGGVPLKLEVTKSGGLNDANIQSGRWQMEIRLVYKEI